MGNQQTEIVKLRKRRKRVRALLPHITDAAAARLAAIADPLTRFDAIVETAIATGATQATIDRCEKARFEYLVTNHGGWDAATKILFDRQPDQADDTRHRPTWVDPVLRGTARATGQTAKAVRARKTVTAWQHEQRERTP